MPHFYLDKTYSNKYITAQQSAQNYFSLLILENSFLRTLSVLSSNNTMKRRNTVEQAEKHISMIMRGVKMFQIMRCLRWMKQAAHANTHLNNMRATEE